ncbi:hypothetical protein CDV31_012786 [Fusarium ambrosium]|uniref:Uncharacterized protein n=1 Tax=Fusarium ambrosium TaxID=131363 RepID=A0A428T7H3_9HYPO|nr:hypothetical protein CDV31_012786 [Fusarium ambrosium]
MLSVHYRELHLPAHSKHGCVQTRRGVAEFERSPQRDRDTLLYGSRARRDDVLGVQVVVIIYINYLTFHMTRRTDREPRVRRSCERCRKPREVYDNSSPSPSNSSHHQDVE